MCAFNDQGFRKGFEEEVTAALWAVWEVVSGDKVTEDGPEGLSLRAC